VRASSIDGEVQGSVRDDRALLGLLVEQRDLPWTVRDVEDELGDVLDAITRLEQAGLLHSWDEYLAATHAAMYGYEALRAADDDTGTQGLHRRILAVLLAHPDGRTESDVLHAIDTHGTAPLDGIHRLQRVGAIDRHDDVLCASRAVLSCARLLEQ